MYFNSCYFNTLTVHQLTWPLHLPKAAVIYILMVQLSKMMHVMSHFGGIVHLWCNSFKKIPLKLVKPWQKWNLGWQWCHPIFCWMLYYSQVIWDCDSCMQTKKFKWWNGVSLWPLCNANLPKLCTHRHKRDVSVSRKFRAGISCGGHLAITYGGGVIVPPDFFRIWARQAILCYLSDMDLNLTSIWVMAW